MIKSITKLLKNLHDRLGHKVNKKLRKVVAILSNTLSYMPNNKELLQVNRNRATTSPKMGKGYEQIVQREEWI